MNNFRTHKIIAFFLAVLMILPLIPAVDLTVFAEGADDDYESHIGQYATLDSETAIIGVEPDTTWQDNSWQIFPEDFSDGSVFRIDDYKLLTEEYSDGVVEITLWYQISLISGNVLSKEFYSDGFWVLQRYISGSSDTASALSLFVPEVAEGNVSILGVSSLSMEKYDKPTLTAVSAQGSVAAYTWQIEYASGKWVDIYGEYSATVKLSYGMVASILAANGTSTVNVRCKSTYAGETIYSAAVPVTVYESSTYSISIPRAFADDITEETTSASTTIYTVVINYVFVDGSQAANPYTATIEAGGDLKLTVKSPSVLGYTPRQAEVEIDISDISEDKNYTVYYDAAEVDFLVIHQFQNVSDEGYTEFLRETKRGYTDDMVGEGRGLSEDQMTQYGVYMLPYDVEQKIVADGSKALIIKYDRLYFLMSFELGGGYNVEPIYARVDTPISVGIPIRAGYVFEGWNPTLPTKMPNHNTTISAIWSANPDGVNYFIAYWGENANDNGYSILKVEQHNGVPGSTVNGGDTYGTLIGFHFDRADQGVLIKGDGSSVINVYYKRNTYDLIFAYQGGPQICGGTHSNHNNCKRICGLDEHTHSSDCCDRSGLHFLHECNTNVCDYGYVHTHSDSCYDCGKVAHSSCSVSNGCYGIKFEGIKYGQDTSYWWNQAPAYRWKVAYSGSNVAYTYAPAMPNSNLTVYGQSLSSSYKYTIHYYEEGTTNKVHEDNVYYRDGSGYNLTDEDYIDIPGFICLNSGSTDHKNGVYLIYYRRQSYNLSFKNGSQLIDKGDRLYQADISGVIDSDDALKNPVYTGDDPDGYVFGGWYTTEQCIDGTEWDPTDATMPYNNLILYAKWAPVQHEVKLYITKADMEAGKQYLQTITVDHNTAAQEPAIPDNGEYKFVGWFYMDNGEEKGFDFEMPIRRSMQLYGKWVADDLAKYTIKYAIENSDGSLTYIADDTTGSAIAGYDKSFEAKYGNELYEKYRTGYFPETNSHSFTILLGEENTYTFIYVEKEKVKYTVKYLEKGTNTVLYTQKEDETSEAIHTENFVYIKDYRPDAYQKRIILSSNESENEIIFWYEKDTTHAPVLVKHYLQNPDGATYNTASPYITTTDLDALKGSDYFVDILTTIEGFHFEKAEASHEVDGQKTGVAVTVGNGQVSAKVTDEGLLIELYYDRNEYPYEFKFILQGTDTEVFEPIKGTALYGSQVVQAALPKSGYSVDPASHAITIQIEEDSTAKKNVRVFYYVERIVYINYVAVGGGTVAPEKETVFMSIPEAKGSTPTAKPGYRFDGWYLDAECQNKVTPEYGFVDDATDSATYKFVPLATKVQEMVNPTFYAKFVEIEVTINYVVVGPTDDCGTVTPGSEKLGAATGVANGSVADPNDPTFKFVGWYSNEACTNEYFITADAAIEPRKAADALWIDGTTYYAKFEYNLTSLTITKTGWDSVDPNQTFIFNIRGEADGVNIDVTVHGNGSVTVYGLTVNQLYTITEKTDWSWRYNVESAAHKVNATDATSNLYNNPNQFSYTVQIGLDGTFTFNNTRKTEYWLDGDSWCDNRFISTTYTVNN